MGNRLAMGEMKELEQGGRRNGWWIFERRSIDTLMLFFFCIPFYIGKPKESEFCSLKN